MDTTSLSLQLLYCLTTIQSSFFVLLVIVVGDSWVERYPFTLLLLVLFCVGGTLMYITSYLLPPQPMLTYFFSMGILYTSLLSSVLASIDEWMRSKNLVGWRELFANGMLLCLSLSQIILLFYYIQSGLEFHQ